MAEPTPAPKENFDSMTIEELKVIVDAPPARVNRPNRDDLNKNLNDIDEQINKIRARFNEIKEEKQLIRQGIQIKRVFSLHILWLCIGSYEGKLWSS